MKILLQNQYDDLFGGVETYFKLIKDGLIEKGHQVIAVYTKSGRKKEIEAGNYRGFYLPNLDLEENTCYLKTHQREIKQDLNRLKFIVAQEKPDIIHLNNTHYPRQYRFLGRYAPVIQTVHDFFNCCNTVLKMLPDNICGYPLGASCFKNRCISRFSIMDLWRFKTKCRNLAAMQNFRKLLVATPYMKEVLLYNGFPQSRVEVVSLFAEDWGIRTKNDGQTIIFAGRLTKEKGVIHFMHMLKMLSCDFKAFIVGEGPQKEDCENLAEIMGLKEKVVFTGFLNRNEMKEYFSQASVAVIPSLWPEPFCLVGVEAMSCSVPVVAYHTGGISHWLRDKYNGYLVERGNVRVLAQKVEDTLTNNRLAAEMGNNGRRLFEEKFSQRVHLNNLISVYETMISSRK
jgi:glycosyltransferase involved in cell wall biosynthesis